MFLISIVCALASLGSPVQFVPVDVQYVNARSLTLHEPVVVAFAIRNLSDDAIGIDLGWNRTSAFTLNVTRPDGSVLKAVPPRASGMVRSGRLSIPLGGSVDDGELFLNEWTDFNQVGTYRIEIALETRLIEHGTARDVRLTRNLELEIRNRDASTLQETCRELADSAMYALRPVEFMRGARLLSLIDDPIAVDTMRSILSVTDRVDPIILDGLIRMNTDEARAVLTEVSMGTNLLRAMQARSFLDRTRRR